jgi:hypothetical protein
MHPTARIVLYLISALVIPGLSFFGLGCVLGMAGVVSLRRRARVGRLLWRTRWLFLLLVLGNAYSLPGEPIHLGADWLSPTIEGLGMGVSRALHLLAILVLLDALVLALPRDTQLAGIYGLLRPLGFLGVDARRATVRLGLTLAAMERPVTERRGLRELVSDPEATVHGEDEFTLTLAPWRGRDGVLLLSGMLAMAVLWRYA